MAAITGAAAASYLTVTAGVAELAAGGSMGLGAITSNRKRWVDFMTSRRPRER
jgi:hypothetical protein